MTPPLFRTITADDWRRSLADARARPNVVREQIALEVLRRQAAAARACATGQAESAEPVSNRLETRP